VIVAPIGNGTLIWGIFAAFQDMYEVGVIEHKPAFIGVQVEACRPVVDAWEKNSGEIIPVEDPETVATAIACGDPIDGLGALRAIRETGGQAVSVSDGEVIEVRDFLAVRCGCVCGGAAGVRRVEG